MQTITLADGVTLPDKLQSLLRELEGFSYGLGSKIVPLSLQYPDVIGTNEQGQKVKAVDCSGFVLWALYHLTGGAFSYDPENVNSADLHAIIASKGFTPVPPSAGHETNGSLYVYFLTPEQGGGIGHVLLCYGGVTFESHGGVGPGSRVWGSEAFMGEMAGYELLEGEA